jgi:uncharacterized protein with FMN-binding domain
VSNSGPDKKVANSLLALSSAAVLAVYTAGYLRTKPAADRFALQAAVRRPAVPSPVETAPPLPHSAAVPVAAAPPSSSNRSAAAVRPTGARQRRGPRLQRHSRNTVALTGTTNAQMEPTPEPNKADTIPTIPIAPVTAAPVTAQSPASPVQSVELPAASAAPPPTATVPAKPVYKDGTYLGWGTSRHGDIQAAVVIQDGRIASATIAQCLTRYSCSVIANLPPQVSQRQSPETDYVSGATQSTNAFYYAVVEALSKAK